MQSDKMAGLIESERNEIELGSAQDRTFN